MKLKNIIIVFLIGATVAKGAVPDIAVGGEECLNLTQNSARAEGAVPNIVVGGRSLKHERVVKSNVIQGLTYFRVVEGEVDEKENIAIISTILSEKEALDGKLKLESAGFVKVHILDLPELSPHKNELGKIISIDFLTEQDAKEKLPLIKEVYPNNFTIRNKAENGYLTSGPYDISVLEVDFDRYTGKIRSALAKGHIKDLDTTTNIAKENNAIAAINGGYFVFNEEIGTTGDLAGISVIDGVLASEARNNSPALIITRKNGKNSADILENVTTDISVQIENKIFIVDGVNRKLGFSFGGGNPGDLPTSRAVHDILTKDSSEIVIFNNLYGDTVNINKGEIAFKISKGKIIGIKEEGKFELKKGTIVIKASGERVAQMKSKLKVGKKAIINQKVLSNGKEIKLEKGVYIVNGGPTLLANGALVNNRAVEGWDDSFESTSESLDVKDSVATGDATDRRDFYYGWVLRRHPRTAVGITDDNKLICVVVYGRDYKNSVGANITEMAEIMCSLGAKKAINLDGGGSSMMIIKNTQTGKSSDATGERPVGDAIIFTE